jgi:glycosyltransferase involved in cell wall biosynthesis
VPEGTVASPPLRVLQLCNPAGVGGLERVVQGLCVGLAERGHEVTLGAVLSNDAPLPSCFRSDALPGVKVLPIRVRGRGYLAERRAVRRIIDDIRPQVVHTHGYRADLLHGRVSRRKGAATVSTLHGSSRMGGLSHFFEWCQERALRGFDAVCAVSEPLVRQLILAGASADRVHLVPNALGVEEPPLAADAARRALGLDPDQGPVIGWVGRLIPIKGCDVFLDALSYLGTRPWLAVIVGDGGEGPALEAQAKRLGLQGRVRFLGELPDAARYMSAFDLFVLSSRSEGTPLVLLEAMVAGRPVVATEVGGVGSVLEADRGGWIVPPESPELLARAVAAALDDPVERNARGTASRARVARDYGAPAWIARHEAIYREALAARSRPVSPPALTPEHHQYTGRATGPTRTR